MPKKSEKTSKKVTKTFLFPEKNVAIKAESIEEARKIYQEKYGEKPKKEDTL